MGRCKEVNVAMLSWASILLISTLTVVGCVGPNAGIAPSTPYYGGNYEAPPPQYSYATPWVGPNTPWIYYQGDWFLNGLLYYNYGDRYGWAPYYAYPTTYIVRPAHWYEARWNNWYQQHPQYVQTFTQRYPYWRTHHYGQHYDQNFYNRYHPGQGAGWQRGFHGSGTTSPQPEGRRQVPPQMPPPEGRRPGPYQETHPSQAPSPERRRPYPGQVTQPEGRGAGPAQAAPPQGPRPVPGQPQPSYSNSANGSSSTIGSSNSNNSRCSRSRRGRSNGRRSRSHNSSNNSYSHSNISNSSRYSRNNISNSNKNSNSSRNSNHKRRKCHRRQGSLRRHAGPAPLTRAAFLTGAAPPPGMCRAGSSWVRQKLPGMPGNHQFLIGFYDPDDDRTGFHRNDRLILLI